VPIGGCAWISFHWNDLFQQKSGAGCADNAALPREWNLLADSPSLADHAQPAVSRIKDYDGIARQAPGDSKAAKLTWTSTFSADPGFKITCLIVKPKFCGSLVCDEVAAGNASDANYPVQWIDAFILGSEDQYGLIAYDPLRVVIQ
jgi:hypothetical protein